MTKPYIGQQDFNGHQEITLKLNPYQAYNLHWALCKIMQTIPNNWTNELVAGELSITNLNTGDWVGEIRCLLEETQ